jgi:hypothetical protein
MRGKDTIDEDVFAANVARNDTGLTRTTGNEK